MKKLLFLVAFVCLGVPVFAQNNQQVQTTPRNYFFNNIRASGEWCTTQGATAPYANSVFVYMFPDGAPNAVTLTARGSTNGGRTFSNITTGTSTTGGSIAISGVYTDLCLTATTMTGTGVTLAGTWSGIAALGSVTLDPATLAVSARQVLGGTAGTASTEVQTVQGIASMTPLVGVGNKTNNAAAPSTTNLGVLPAVATVAAPSLTETFQAALSVDLGGGIRLASTYSVSDPCDGSAKTVVSFSISSATTTELLDGSSSNYYYVCAFNIVVGAANNVALVDDVDDNCASPASGLAGGVTAATGWNFAANGGLTLGNGGSTVMKTAGTARRVCLMTSGTAQTSGTITVVAAP